MMSGRLSPAAGIAALAAVGLVSAQGLYLHVVTIDAPDGVPDPSSPLWRIALIAKNPESLAEGLPSTLSPDLREDRIIVSIAPDQVIGGEPQDRHRNASFVIDFDERSVVDLTGRLLEETPRPSIDDLRRFTHAAIPDKHMGRGWDLASRVAERGEGDCTEHAVLLAALARAVGYPARVVTGIALVLGEEETVQAFGHAWTEVHDGTRWIVADGTFLGDEAPTRLLPLATMETEGPGYQVNLLTGAMNHPERLVLLPSRSAGASP